MGKSVHLKPELEKQWAPTFANKKKKKGIKPQGGE
jgi:hypothetical protein